MPRPNSITFVAILFVLSGFFFAWELIYGAQSEMVNYNIGVMTVLIGAGIWKGKPSALKFSKLWLAAWFLSCLTAAGFLIFNKDALPAIFVRDITAPGGSGIMILQLVVYFNIGLWCWKILSSTKNAMFFHGIPPQPYLDSPAIESATPTD